MTIAELAAKYEQYVIDMRREFHENPELSHHEERTVRRIREELDKLGIPNITVGHNNVIGTLEGGKPGKKIAILALGDMQELGSQVAEELNAALYNPLSANILDTDCLDHLARHYQAVITLENNILDGGFGQKVAGYLADRPVLVKTFGEKREYTDVDQSYDQILVRNQLTAEQIVASVKQLFN